MHRARGLAIVPLIIVVAACAASGSAAVSTASIAATASAAPSVAPSPSETPITAPSVSPSPFPSPSPLPSPGGSPGISHKTGPSDLVLRISIAGGFIAPQAQLFALPEVAIYGDGTVLVRDLSGSTTAIPMMQGMLMSRISEAGLQQILAAAADAGLLGPNGQYQGGIMAEASTTTFLVNAEDHTHTISVTALDKPGGDPATQALRDKLQAFEIAMQDIPTFVGATNVTVPQAPYQPTGIEVFVTGGGQPSTKALAWPLSTPLSLFGQPIASSGSGGGIRQPDLRCGIVTGSDLTALLPLLAKAGPDSVWNSDGSYYTLMLRPEFPDELTCPGV